MIYLDNNATTQIAPEVLEAVFPVMRDFYANPSSAYGFAASARRIIEAARESVARLVGAQSPAEIIFNSGGTESDNHAILGTLEAFPEKKHIVTTSVEHEAVRNLCDKLEAGGYEITRLDVNEKGLLDLDSLRKALRPDTALVSVMAANNETGILFPVGQIAEIVKENSAALFHVDAVNAVGKIPFDLKKTEIDLFSLSGHKFHAPKGIGALYIRQGIEIPPLLIGGRQQNARRAGTEAVHQIAGLGAAAKLVYESPTPIQPLRDRLENFILENIPQTKLNGTSDSSHRLPNTSSVSFSNLNGEVIMARLDQRGICVSTGSACNAADHTASPTLQAMNIPYTDAMGAIRFSLGRYNTAAEIESVIEQLPAIIEEIRAFSL